MFNFILKHLCDNNLLLGLVFNASREWYRYYLWITRFSFKKIFYSFLADLLLQISASFLAIFSQDFHSGRRSWGGSQVAHRLCTRHCQVIGVKVFAKIYRIVKRKNHPHLKESGDFCPVQGKHFTEAAVRRITISWSKFCSHNRAECRTQVLVEAQPGDLILWDSRLIHGGRTGLGPMEESPRN